MKRSTTITCAINAGQGRIRMCCWFATTAIFTVVMFTATLNLMEPFLMMIGIASTVEKDTGAEEGLDLLLYMNHSSRDSQILLRLLKTQKKESLPGQDLDS